MNAPDGQTYKFSPLPSQSSIRLLRIISGPEELRIKCSIEVVDLNDNPEPEYDCLSYTWGNPLYQKILPPEDGREITADRKHRIECDGLIICIAENLLEALRQLSRNGFSPTCNSRQQQKRSRIWVDAICIHQEDMAERSSQVAMMERIYRQAQTVVIWLGPNDALTSLGIKVMQRLASVPPENRAVELPDDLYDHEVYRRLGISICTLQDWLALATFLQRTWFSRVWVLQESFAARKIMVFCGTHILKWSDVTAASKTLAETGLGRLLREEVEQIIAESMASTKYVGNTLNNLCIFEEMRENATLLTLETLLQQGRYFAATNKKDHVYAVLGMWTPSPGSQTASNFIKPDYELSVQDVFTKASAVSMREMGDLNLLSLVECFSDETKRMENLPSWVPDYTVTPLAEPLRGNPRPAEGDERWQASKGLKWKEPLDAELPLLPVRGMIIDTITKRAATEAEILDEHQVYTLLAILKECLDSDSTPYEDGPIEAFWRTLIKDTFRCEPADEEARQAVPVLITMWVWRLEALIEELENRAAPTPSSTTSKPSPTTSTTPHPLNIFSEASSKLRALIQDLSPRDKTSTLPSWSDIRTTIALGNNGVPESFDVADEQIQESLRVAYMGRRLFRTREGYLGIGPQSLKEGNEVWILAGAAVPIVLQTLPSGNYALVGEAYVHGIMNGEAVGTAGGESRVREIYIE